MKASDELRLNGARLTGADYSGRRFGYFLVANGSRLTRCDFRGVRATDGCLGGGLQPSVYTECVFDGSTLQGDGLDPGRATFVSCSFLDVTLSGLTFIDAEFVDCVFSGSLESVTFSADPWARDAELGRTTNRYEGNDFSAARMTDVDFRGGIDLDRQRLPEGAGHLVLRDAAGVLDLALRDIERWADAKDRDEALATIDTLEFDVQGGQRDLFTDKAFLTKGLSPEAAERLLAIFLEHSAR
ncbi:MULTISPECIES: hypothetical protein [unclassified Nonomuraea]|uniref:hypothetical protein n=1 Tax=unclassified Nonomuraea TaxID=2593643 RepID=UPI0035C0BE6E